MAAFVRLHGLGPGVARRLREASLAASTLVLQGGVPADVRNADGYVRAFLDRCVWYLDPLNSDPAFEQWLGDVALDEHARFALWAASGPEREHVMARRSAAALRRALNPNAMLHAWLADAARARFVR